MRRQVTSAVVGGVLLAAALAGCAGGSGSSGSKEKAFASSSAGQADKRTADQIIKPCLPGSDAAFLDSGTRKRFAKCLDIPQSQRPAFEDCLLKHASGGALATRAGRSAYLEVAVPGCVAAAKGVKP